MSFGFQEKDRSLGLQRGKSILERYKNKCLVNVCHASLKAIGDREGFDQIGLAKFPQVYST